MVRLNLPREKRSAMNWRIWSSNIATSLGARSETSQKRWLTERISAESRCPSRSRSAKPYPVMLRIIRHLPGEPEGMARRGATSNRGADYQGFSRVGHFGERCGIAHRFFTAGWGQLLRGGDHVEGIAGLVIGDLEARKVVDRDQPAGVAGRDQHPSPALDRLV